MVPFASSLVPFQPASAAHRLAVTRRSQGRAPPEVVGPAPAAQGLAQLEGAPASGRCLASALLPEGHSLRAATRAGGAARRAQTRRRPCRRSRAAATSSPPHLRLSILDADRPRWSSVVALAKPAPSNAGALVQPGPNPRSLPHLGVIRSPVWQLLALPHSAAARRPRLPCKPASCGHWHCLGGLACAVGGELSMRVCSYLLLANVMQPRNSSRCTHRYGALHLALHAASPYGTAKPRALQPPQRRRGRGAALVAKPRASRALGVRDGLPRPPPGDGRRASRAQDARGRAAAGRSARRGPCDDTDWTGARDKLLVALQRSEAFDAQPAGREAHPLRRPGVLLHGERRDGPIPRGDSRDADLQDWPS